MFLLGGMANKKGLATKINCKKNLKDFIIYIITSVEATIQFYRPDIQSITSANQIPLNPLNDYFPGLSYLCSVIFSPVLQYL